MLTDQLAQAIAAFTDAVDADLNPSLAAITWPADGQAEYDIVIHGQSAAGVIHEEITRAAEIAVAHGGRLFLQQHDGSLAIVWPLSRDDAPGPVGPDGPSLAEKERVRARGRRPRAKEGVA